VQENAKQPTEIEEEVDTEKSLLYQGTMGTAPICVDD
jgi:hypothetical protein